MCSEGEKIEEVERVPLRSYSDIIYCT
jgi:hypothetical protein